MIQAAEKRRERLRVARAMKVTKAHRICYTLLNGPKTRIDIMREVHAIERSELVFLPRSNNCYFAPRPQSDPYMSSCAWKVSVVIKKLIKPVGKKGNAILYGLTPKGRKLGEFIKNW